MGVLDKMGNVKGDAVLGGSIHQLDSLRKKTLDGNVRLKISFAFCPRSTACVRFSIVEDFSHPLLDSKLLRGVNGRGIGARLS